MQCFGNSLLYLRRFLLLMYLLFRINVSLRRHILLFPLVLPFLYDDLLFLHLAPRLVRALRMRDGNKAFAVKGKNDCLKYESRA